MSRDYSILPDANIWASATLHSWFGLFAKEAADSWSFHWTEDIMAEAVRARRRRFPRSGSKQIEDLRDRVTGPLSKNRISNYPYDDSVRYVDEGDAHVHSAAVHAGINIIVTDNVKDFRFLYEDEEETPYQVLTADDFLMLATGLMPQEVDTVILLQHRYRVSLGIPFNLVRTLRRAGCPRFAEYVGTRLQSIELA